MKPKNRVYCHDCGRFKMLFETEKKAMTFIKFNADELMQTNGYVPLRAYYCEACCGWHLTSSKQYTRKKTLTESVIERYQAERQILKAERKAEEKKKNQKVKQLKAIYETIEKNNVDVERCKLLKKEYDEICGEGVVPKARKLRRAIEHRFTEVCGRM